MSTKMTSSVRRHSDHFEPQDTDPHEQRRLRGNYSCDSGQVAAVWLALSVLREADRARFGKLASSHPRKDN